MESSRRQSKNSGAPDSGPGARDVEFDLDRRNEQEYPAWWTRKRLLHEFYTLCEDTYWNSYICVIALAAIVWVAIGLNYTVLKAFDVIYNVSYAVHVFGVIYNLLTNLEASNFTFCKTLAFLVDMATFSHYVSVDQDFKLFCYYLRMLRPFRYLWALNDSNLKGNVLGTTLKFCYIFCVMRVTWALVWLNIDSLERTYWDSIWPTSYSERAMNEMQKELQISAEKHDERRAIKFLAALYLVNKMFIPIGPSVPPSNDVERIACLAIMLSGCLVVTAFAVASMSLVISLYMRPEESFRARYGLIVKEMKESHIPPSLRVKVETFYRMYWQKQGAVYSTELLPTFPPTLPATIYMDIYFEATQKSTLVSSVSDALPQGVHASRSRRPLNVTRELITKLAGSENIKKSINQNNVGRMSNVIEISMVQLGCLQSRVLCDLSYQFLSELAKKMDTIHFIPGDVIIKRLSNKSSYIYITYGDIEMVTAEDDSTAVLRMTRGTVLTPCGVCAPAGFGRAHLEVRAATFCTAHVLKAPDLWRKVLKHRRTKEETEIILNAYNEHLTAVKSHYRAKIPEEVKYKSSILHFKRCLMALKEASDANGKLLLAGNDIFLEIAGSYIMRNREDATLTDESDAICLRPTFPCILQPNSSLQKAWNFLVSGLILAVCSMHPYYLVFTKLVPIEFRFFDNIVTVVFILDLIVHLSTGANVEEGVPITFKQTSSQQMRSCWFVLDVLGTAPIFEFIGEGHFAGINKILRLPKVFRVLKELEDACVYRSHVLRFLSYCLLLMIACYLIAALQQGFMCFQFGYCQVTNLTHSPYWEKKPLDEETVENRLAFAMYWAISMMIFTSHKETWGTDNWNNVLYTLIVLEVCIVLRIFIEAFYSATILVTTALREDYDACILIVKNFLIRNEVDPVLRQRFISYLQLCWYTDKAYSMTNKRSIFFDLPSHVYQDIVAKQRSKYILTIPFMKFLSQENLKAISSKARLFYTSPNEILLNTGDISNEMYVIKQGICEILSPDTQNAVGLLHAKCHFGVMACLLRLPTFYTIRAVTNVQVFSISRKHLLRAIEVPQIKDAIEFIKTQPEFRRLLVRREPFTTYKLPDPIPNTEQFQLPRKHEHDSAFLTPFYRLGFLSVLRYIFPRFTIRPDGRYLLRYEWFRAFCAFSSAMVFPSYTYMVLQWPWLYYVALLLDLSAFFDIFQRMLVGYYNEDGILVYHPYSTAAHYLKGAFVVDLVGCACLENLENPPIRSDNKFDVTQMEQVLMMNRLIQLYRLPSAMRTLRNCIERRDILIVLKTIPLFMVLLNVLTCFMVLNSVSIYSMLDTGKWMIVPLKDQGGSWVELFGKEFRFNLTASPFNLHLGTYFWAVYETSTTGYNNLKPSNVNLIHLLFLGMLAGAILITFFSVRIISIRANVNKALAEFQEHMKDMVAYMRRENLKPELQKLVLDYYEYTWDKMGGVDYRNMLKLCDQITLRTDAILHIYGPTFFKCPILANCDVSLLRIVGRAVHSAYFLRGMYVVEANDVISEMYFVDYGEVDARETVGDKNTVVNLPRGSIFGNLDGYSTVRCPVTFMTTSRVHLLRINSSTFHNIIKEFPIVKKQMKKLRPDMKNFIMGNIADYATQSPHSRRSSIVPVVVTSGRDLINNLYFRNKYVQMYLIIVSLLCVYMDLYNAGFQNNSMPLIVTLYVLDFCFYLKILLQYILPLIVNSASLKKVLLPDRKAYFSSEFRYDLLSCIPIELFSFLNPEYRWSIFACLRLNRMFRIVTVYNCLKRHHERITINLILSTVSSAFIWFTLFVHTTSCLWYFIGTVEEWREPNSSWIYKDDGVSWCNSVYVCSVYFMLTTFTQNGVGDIMPKKQSEVIFVCCLQIISTMIFMIYVGEFSNIIQYQSFRSCTFYSKYLELQDFLNNNRVSKNLVHIVNKYSLHLWRETRGAQAPQCLRKAPRALRLQLMSAAYLHHLTKHHVFENCEPAFLRQLVGCLKLLTYNEDMYVVKSSEITDAMYLIHTGKIEETADASNKVPRIYPAGSYFGVLEGLTHNMPFTKSYRTLIKSQVLTLHLDDWLYLIKHYPASRDAMSKHMKYDDLNSDGGGGPEVWPKKPPKSSRSQAINPTVTELVDNGSPPTPPQDSDTLIKTAQLDMPEATQWPLGDKPTTLQPGVSIHMDHADMNLYPSSSNSDKTIALLNHGKNKKNTQAPVILDELTGTTPLLTKVTEKDRQLTEAAKKEDNSISKDVSSREDTLLIEVEEATISVPMKKVDDRRNDDIETIEQDLLNQVSNVSQGHRDDEAETKTKEGPVDKNSENEERNILPLANLENSQPKSKNESLEDEKMNIQAASLDADGVAAVTKNIEKTQTPQRETKSEVTSVNTNAEYEEILRLASSDNLRFLNSDDSKTNRRELENEKLGKQEALSSTDGAVASTSKDTEKAQHAQTKGVATDPYKIRRSIRIRYDDGSEKKTSQARSEETRMTTSERNLRIMDSDMNIARRDDFNDKNDLPSFVSSKTSKASSISSIQSLEKKKKMKKKQ